MAAPTVSQLREGLKTRLDTIAGLQVSAEGLANPTPPCAIVMPDEPFVEYDQTMGRGLDKWLFYVQVFAALTTDKGAQKKLDSFLAPSGALSIKATIEGDRQLGGVCDDLRVTTIDGYGDYVVAERGIGVMAARVHVEIYAIGT